MPLEVSWVEKSAKISQELSIGCTKIEWTYKNLPKPSKMTFIASSILVEYWSNKLKCQNFQEFQNNAWSHLYWFYYLEKNICIILVSKLQKL